MSKTVTVKPILETPPPPVVEESKIKAFLAKPRIKLYVIAAIALLLTAGVSVFFGVANYWVNQYDRIYDGVYAMGVNLSGMTVTEAAEALDNALSQSYASKSMNIAIDEKSAVITAEDAKINISSGDAARRAYDKGRDGSFFNRLAFVMNTGNTLTEVDLEGELYIDQTAVQSRVTELAESIVVQPTDPTWTIGDTTLELQPGKPGRTVETDPLVDTVLEKLHRLDFSDVAIQSQPIAPPPIPVDDLYNQVHVAPQDARLELDSTKSGDVIPHVDGITFDKQAAADALASGAENISIPIVRTSPNVTTEALTSNLFKDEFPECTTSTATSTANRAGNIALCAEFINGTIIMPGENFSFNEIVGQRTEARGFRIAGIYRNGKLEQDVGGGICQASTTVYNAALLANLEIVDRRSHSMLVSYVKPGLDATVSWGSIDFVFRNNTEYPIRINASHVNRRLTVSISGTNPNPNQIVEMESKVLSRTPFESVILKVNKDLKPGEKKLVSDPHDGCVAETYRIIKDLEGNEISRTFEAKSSYRKVNAEYEVGPDAEEEDPEPTKKPKDEDEDKTTPKPSKTPKPTKTPKPEDD